MRPPKSLRVSDPDRCWVCETLLADAGGDPSSIREGHHVVPQAYGGKNGPVIPLCIAHHDLVHLVASKKIAKLSIQPFLPKEPQLSSRILFLSEVIHTAHSRLNADPNKKVNIGLTLTRASADQVQLLCDFYKMSRQSLLLKLLSEEYSRVFPSRSKSS